MTNTQKLIEEISKLNGHMFECGDFEGLMDKVRQVAEAAKAEERERLARQIDGLAYRIDAPFGGISNMKYISRNEVKALMSNNKKDV